MATQIQIRRGTTAEHSSFTGAVGELSMDTTANTVKIHDGSTVGGIDIGGMSDAAIKTAYENNADTNEFSDAEKTKLSGIETGATTDQTDAEIKTAYENNANTNAFTDALSTKLSGIETNATADQTGAEIKTAYQAEANAYTDTKDTKLSGIETGADVTDAVNVGAAGAIMDSDISAAEGFLRKTGTGTYEAIKSNLAASAAPTSTDDTGSGYSVGSVWIDTTNDNSYLCVDNTSTSAVWLQTDPDVVIPLAQVTKSAPQSVANATITTLTWDSENFDTDAIHDNSTNNSRLTAKTAGKYLVVAEVNFASNNTGGRQVYFYKNGVFISQNLFANNGLGADYLVLVTFVDLAVNDYIEAKVWQGSGGNLNIETTSQFSMSRQGV